jgi:hypothetical protein
MNNTQVKSPKNPAITFHSCTCGQKDPNLPKVTHPLLAVKDAKGHSTGQYTCSRCGKAA